MHFRPFNPDKRGTYAIAVNEPASMAAVDHCFDILGVNRPHSVACPAGAGTRNAPNAAKQDPDRRGKTSYDQISPALLGQETFADMMAKDKADKPAVMARQKKLLEERYDLAAAARHEGQDDARQADPGRPDGQAAGGHDLGAAGRDVAGRDPRQGPVPQGLPAAAAPQPRGGRHALPADGDQAARRAWSASTSTSTCPSTSCPSSRRPSS